MVRFTIFIQFWYGKGNLSVAQILDTGKRGSLVLGRKGEEEFRGAKESSDLARLYLCVNGKELVSTKTRISF